MGSIGEIIMVKQNKYRNKTGNQAGQLFRRDYLRLSGLSALAGVAGIPTVASPVDAATASSGTLTIGGTAGGEVPYELTVESSLQKSTAMGATIDSSDAISGRTASGSVSENRDSYDFAGVITILKLMGM